MLKVKTCEDKGKQLDNLIAIIKGEHCYLKKIDNENLKEDRSLNQNRT